MSDDMPKVDSLAPKLDRRLTSNSESCSNGLPPPLVLDTYDFQIGREDPLAGVPAGLRFRRKLSQIQTTSAVELGHTALSTEPKSRDGVLESMINIFSMQLTQMESERPDELSKFRRLAATCCD